MLDSLMVKEVIDKLNSIQYVVNIAPILSVIIVAFIGWYFTYIIHKSEKKDKYLLSLAKEKFEAAQSAYNYSKKFISIIHKEGEKKFSLLEEVRKWFNENNLYLNPNIRRDFDKAINQLCMYQNTLELYNQLKKNGNTEKAEEQYQKFKQDYKEIVSLNEQIQKNIDVYYKTS